MFERYTEKARRVIFFSRHEASELGGSAIEPHHILLGLIREDKQLITRFCKVMHTPLDSMRDGIRASTGPGERVSASVDMPLSAKAKDVLSYAAEESDSLNNRHIGTEHLLLGLLRTEQTTVAEVLIELGIDLNTVRDEFRERTSERVYPDKVADVEEMRRLAADARSLAKVIVRKAERIEEICDQLSEGSSFEEDKND